MSSDRPTRALVLAGVFLAIVAVVGLQSWWKRRALTAEAREHARPACIARLGDLACEEHLRDNHDDCARLNIRVARSNYGRGSTMVLDEDGYLQCVVAGSNEWVTSMGRRITDPDRDRARTNDGG